jgi:hypothetical protein
MKTPALVLAAALLTGPACAESLVYPPGTYAVPWTAQDDAVLVARQDFPILPPPEYDHPFAGKLVIIRALGAGDTIWMCPKPALGMTMTLCTLPLGPSACVIFQMPEVEKETIKLGWTLNILMRHEIAHCNGWPADHPGLRRSAGRPGL